MLHARTSICLSCAALVACSAGDDASGAQADESTWLDDTEAELPARLSQAGFYADLATLAPAEGLIAYEPLWPLWSSGADKARLLHVPADTVIDAAGSAWEFPVGTVLVKTFSYTDLVPGDGVRPVETRVIVRRGTRWDYGVFVWNDDRSDAELLPGNWEAKPATLPAADGSLRHTVPSRLDCRTCHETAERAFGVPVLGVAPLQLDPALAATSAFASAPAAQPVEGRTPAETAALGYFVGNCIHCHNDGGAVGSSFSLLPDVAVANTVGQSTESDASGIRVVPGNPDESVLFIATVLAREPAYDGPVKPMPPIAVDRTDPSARGLLQTWIEGLE
jgi:hypothetical protein